MTEEEKAEEYLQSIEGDDCVIITDREERKQAYLAGLHEGQTQLVEAKGYITSLLKLVNDVCDVNFLSTVWKKKLENAEQFIKE